jgi:hypothetical protein
VELVEMLVWGIVLLIAVVWTIGLFTLKTWGAVNAKLVVSLWMAIVFVFATKMSSLHFLYMVPVGVVLALAVAYQYERAYTRGLLRHATSDEEKKAALVTGIARKTPMSEGLGRFASWFFLFLYGMYLISGI